VRILHLIQRYWPVFGGAEVHFGEVSAFLAAQGHQVEVVTTDALDFELFWDPRRRRLDRLEDTHQGVHIRRFPVHNLPGNMLTYSALRRMLWLLSGLRRIPPAWIAALSRYTPWTPELRRWLATTDEPFDLVAGMNICFEPLLEAGLRFARRRGIPFAIYPLTHLGAGAKPGADALGRFYTMRHQVDTVLRSDALFAQTPAERDFYVSCGMPASRIVVAGPGVHPEAVLGGDGRRFRQRHDIPAATPLVLALSAMAYDKGTVHVVEAVRQLWRQGRDVELVLIGALLTPFQHYLERLPVADCGRIRVLGPVSEEEKRDALAAADIFALPSRTDSFGIVYLEAWVYRKPVIGARTWGVTDVIADGEDGCIVPFGDVPALADTIARLADNPELRAALGERGEQKVYAQHTWAQKHALVHQRYLDLVEK